MGMFKWAEEESKGSPLFAAALGAGALASEPVARYLNNNVLVPSMRNVGQTIAGAQPLEQEVIKNLKAKLIDKNLVDKLHIVQDKRVGDAFVAVPKTYLPLRSEVESLIQSGGLKTLEGKVNPIKAIHDIRKARGFVSTGAIPDAVSLAHELGHATSINQASKLRSSAPYRMLDAIGRRVAQNSKKNAIVAALAAGSFKSDDDRKWLVPGLMAATQLPLLAEEATASVKGLNALKAIKDLPSPTMGVVGEESAKLLAPAVMENAGKYLRRAWGTYGLASAGLLAAPLLAIKAREQFDKSRD